jgi:DNA-binding PadR family transcriptional regulator
MNVRILCLGILNAGPTSGYEIRKRVGEGTLAHFAEASYGSIYPALDKLETDGLVTSHEERDPGKPTRRVFTITSAGRAAFIAAIHQMPGEDVFRSPFLLIAASAPLVDPAHIRRVLDARLAWCRAELARMEEERIQCPDNLADKDGWLWTLEYGIEMYRTSIRWLEANRARLECIAGTSTAAGMTHSVARSASPSNKSAPIAPGE